MKFTNKLLAALLALLMLVLLLPVTAQTQADNEIRAYADTVWNVKSYNDGSRCKFTVSRNRTDCVETVYYRTISQTAVEGQHFTKTTGSITFGVGDSSKDVWVQELTPSGAYKFQVGTTRSYLFEVTDAGGFRLASAERAMTTGTSVSANALKFVSVPINDGRPATVTDAGYKQGYYAVPLDQYYNAAPKEYLNLVNVQDLVVSISFKVAEEEDGYEHMQIYVNEDTDYDTGAGNETPGNVNICKYAACFGHTPGSTDSTWAEYKFPVASVSDNAGKDKAWSVDLGNEVGKLYLQKFHTTADRTEGLLRVSLSSLEKLGVRFNASGHNSDKWYASQIMANIKALPYKTGATIDSIIISPAPAADGKYRRGNYVYFTVPMNQIVTFTGTPLIKTGWGDFPCIAGDNTNVLTFG